MKNLFFYYLLAAILLMIIPKTSRADFIVNHNISTSELSREDIFQIFFFIKKFDNRLGVKLTVILPPPNSYLFKQLATQELDMSASQYLNSIKARMVDGSAAPVFAESEAEVLIKIANTPYSIGYFYNSIKINDGYGVKTVVIK